MVVRKRECLSNDVWKSLTHIFIDEDFCLRHDDVVKDLVNEGFQCLSPDYIRDYVAQVSAGRLVKVNVSLPMNFSRMYFESGLKRGLNSVLLFPFLPTKRFRFSILYYLSE